MGHIYDRFLIRPMIAPINVYDLRRYLASEGYEGFRASQEAFLIYGAAITFLRKCPVKSCQFIVT
jgi:hypothetical protein